MTAKEKSEELLEKFQDVKTLHFWAEYENNEIILINQAKICALITVNEIIEALSFHSWQNRNEIEYYEEVKHEIKKL